MDATTQFIVTLFLLIACAVVAGELVSRLGQSALVGQLAVGVVLGPTLLGPYLGLSSISSELSGLEILATFFVLMTAGLAVTPDQIAATGVSAGLLGVALFVLPFLTGAAVVRLLYPSLGWATTLFVALTISITALPVLGIMLHEFRLLQSRFGTYLLNGALVNELAAVTAFSVLLRVADQSTLPWLSAAIGAVTVGVFLCSILAVHYSLRALRQLRIWDRWVTRVRFEWHSREAGFAILMVGALAAALYSQAIGLTFVVGAFYAGLLVTPESVGVREHREITRVFDAVTWGFFIPLFFALVGYDTNFRLLGSSYETLGAFATIVIFAVASKFLIGASITRALGWSGDESFAAGFFVTSRGAVELAMAVILVDSMVFNETQFTIVAAAGLITTILSPIGARPFVRAMKSAALRARREAKEPPTPWVGTTYLPPKVSGVDGERPPLPNAPR